MKRAVIASVIIIGVWSARADAGTAEAKLSPTTPESKAAGWVRVEDAGGGLKVTAHVSGVSPGKHGFHIHELGSCDDAGKAAGGHYNPLGAPHGLATKDGPAQSHAGDLGNIEVGPDGQGHLEAVLHGLSIVGGEHNVAGRSFILHEKEDDFGQPLGNAGGRIACGVIQAIPAQTDGVFRSATEFFEFRTPAGWTAFENAKEGAVTVTFKSGAETRALLRITYGETKLADEPVSSQKKALKAHAGSMSSGQMLKAAMPDMTIADSGVEEARVGSAFAVRRRYTASDTSGAVRVFVYEHFIQSGLWFAVSYSYGAQDTEARTAAEAILSSFKFS